MQPSLARQLGRAHRQSLAPAQRAVFNQQIQHQVAQLTGRIATYWALPEEADPGRKPGQYLPVIQGASLVFARYQSDQQCQPGALKIPVPIDAECLSVDQMDWVLVPLTAFDGRGNRVGMGGGFYDQTLSAIPRSRRIGIAYAGQDAGAIEAQAWDIPLGHVITPTGWR